MFFLGIKIFQISIALFAVFSGLFTFIWKPKNRFHFLFFLTNLMVAGLIGPIAIMEIIASFYTYKPLFLDVLSSFSGSFIPSVALHTISELTKFKLKKRTIIFLYTVSFLIFLGFRFFTREIIIQGHLERVFDPILPVYGIFFVFCLTWLNYLLIKKLTSETDIREYKLLLIFIVSQVATLIFVSIFGFLLPIFGYKSAYYFAQLGAIIPVFSNFFAVIKYQAFEIKTAAHFDLLELNLLKTQLEKETLLERENYLKRLNSTILHEVKNLNIGIRSTVERILEIEKSLTKNSSMVMVSIINQATNLYNFSKNYLLSELSDFSKTKKNNNWVNLDVLISEVIAFNQYFLLSKNIKPLVEIPKSLEISGEKESLVILFNNIINNAIKYSFDNEEIHIKANPKVDSLIVSFTDFGEGISDNIKGKLFQNISQDKAKKHSTGYGLKISKTICEEHNYSIDFQSKEFDGTTVFIKIAKGDFRD